MDLETTWYEFSPYVYGLAGLISVLNVHSILSIISGVLLLCASATILRMRWVYRRKLDSNVEEALKSGAP